MAGVPLPAPESYSNLLQALGLLLIAAWLLFLNFGSRLNRALALFFVLRAAFNVAVGLSEDPDLTGYGFRLFPYFSMAVPFAALYFAYVYRTRHGRARERRWVPWALLTAALLAELLYVLNPYRWRTESGGEGPLVFVGGLTIPSYALIAYLLGRDWLREPAGPRARSLWIASVGFVLDAAYIGLVAFVTVVTRGIGYDYGPLFLSTWASGLIPILALISFLVPPALQAEPSEVRRGARKYILAVALAWVGTALTTTFYFASGSQAAERAAYVLDGVFTLALPVFVTYAVVRHQLFDLDVKIRWTLKQSTVAAIFVAVFFVVSESAQTLFSRGIGPLFGIAATGLLVFAIAPLQHFAERVATVAMPHVKPLSQLSTGERERLYRDQLRFAWKDGRLDRTERAMLRNLRERLGISAEEAERLEAEVTQA